MQTLLYAYTDDFSRLVPAVAVISTGVSDYTLINVCHCSLETNKSQWDDPRLCGESTLDGGGAVAGSDHNVMQMAQAADGPGSPLTPLDQMELPYGWERIDDPQYGTYYIE